MTELRREVSQTDKAASYRFELPATKLPPDQLTLHCTFGKQELKEPLSRILVVKAHETALASKQVAVREGEIDVQVADIQKRRAD